MASSAVVSVLTQAAIYAAQMYIEKSPSLVWTTTSKPIPNGKNQASFPVMPTFDMSTPNDYTAPSAEAWTVTAEEVSLTRNAALVTISEEKLRSSDWNIAEATNMIGEVMGDAAVRAVNDAIFASFASLTAFTGDGTATTMSEAIILSAVKTLRNARARAPYYLAITPEIEEDIMTLYKSSTSITSDQVRNSVTNTGFLPPLLGCIPITVNNISNTYLTAASITTGMYSADALGFGFRNPLLRIDSQYDVDLDGHKVGANAYFGVGVINATKGVAIEIQNAGA